MPKSIEFNWNPNSQEEALKVIEEINELGGCPAGHFKSIPIPLNTARYESTRQKVDMVAQILRELGVNHHDRGKLAYT